MTWFIVTPFCFVDLLAASVTVPVCTVGNNKSLVAVLFRNVGSFLSMNMFYVCVCVCVCVCVYARAPL
jgi:hypothetical protein